jgi:hypothetical protein
MTSLSPLMRPSMMRLRRYAVASSANGTCSRERPTHLSHACGDEDQMPPCKAFFKSATQWHHMQQGHL